MRPDGAMAKDVVGDQEASRRGYERMCADGYGDVAIPVWQLMPCWVGGLSVEANALLAARDPVLRFYCDRAPLVAIGGLNQSPCRRGERHRYLAGPLPRLSRHPVLGTRSGESRSWSTGSAAPGCSTACGWTASWWIHDARAEVLAVLEDGLIKTIRLTRTGARSFFPLLDLMSCNLRSLLSAYAGLWTFPGPARVPTDLEDLDARLELRRRLARCSSTSSLPRSLGRPAMRVPAAAAVA